ncbi:hypothetical protein TNIN_76721 [Trichonephila inaurata madagascariensis]|uniref:Uncharacterized protein n=1 Tax=Trichonephila inaurata madagascariensis TaxID=2747483 RepID=A0A8X6Y8C8_9ARAC|nr:hypothetical protein TNIN_76721 [Trichonephila inaurata madagascariensis]
MGFGIRFDKIRIRQHVCFKILPTAPPTYGRYLMSKRRHEIRSSPAGDINSLLIFVALEVYFNLFKRKSLNCLSINSNPWNNSLSFLK